MHKPLIPGLGIKLLVFEITYHIYYVVAPISGMLHDFFFS